MQERGILRRSFTNVGSWTPDWRCPREDASPAHVVDSGGGESLRSPEGRRRMGCGLESRISVEAQRSARHSERLGYGASGSGRGGWLRPRCWRSPAVGTDWSTLEAGGARSTGSQRWRERSRRVCVTPGSFAALGLEWRTVEHPYGGEAEVRHGGDHWRSSHSTPIRWGRRVWARHCSPLARICAVARNRGNVCDIWPKR
ncbi:skin secretory protein xP2-like [Iris pallida]|uniref:Skin secretory protein xP2-like n=1 Tax=Iris pallida TaxID=29817 RepID=A0AAX6ECL7_IRIPA|nr:skin secretory protein xP2-like [Iris pallida]